VAASRVTPAALSALPVAALAVLAAWVLWEVIHLDSGRALQAGVVLWGFANVCLAFGLRYRSPSMRRAGLVLLGFLYFGLHVLFLPLDLIPALAFLTLFLVHIELRVLADRFVPIYRRDLSTEARVRIRGGLVRGAARLTLAGAMAFLLPVFAEDLAVAGTLPVTTIPTALILAGGLVAVIVLLALMPVWQRRRERAYPSWNEDPRGKL